MDKSLLFGPFKIAELINTNVQLSNNPFVCYFKIWIMTLNLPCIYFQTPFRSYPDLSVPWLYHCFFYVTSSYLICISVLILSYFPIIYFHIYLLRYVFFKEIKSYCFISHCAWQSVLNEYLLNKTYTLRWFYFFFQLGYKWANNNFSYSEKKV